MLNPGVGEQRPPPYYRCVGVSARRGGLHYVVGGAALWSACGGWLSCGFVVEMVVIRASVAFVVVVAVGRGVGDAR